MYQEWFELYNKIKEEGRKKDVCRLDGKLSFRRQKRKQ